VTLTALAPAKINRELRVGGRRPDGYHEIHSRLVSISLADRISVAPAPKLRFTCDVDSLPAGEENLVVRAATLLARRAGRDPAVALHLEKRVPIGGGLGGGSSDAAITLRLLAALWRLREPEFLLEELAAELGSDVPFFLAGGEADARGRGELLTPIEDGEPADLLLLVPPFVVSTAAVYAAYAGGGTLPERLEVASARDRYLGPNDLAPAVLDKEPRMGAYLESAAFVTPDFAISGSGATVVLHGAGPEAEEYLEKRHPEARLHRCHTLARDEFARRTNPRGGGS
jgi:4-diphosphocytidyl-2-C-methyl-D-erythritol kinase